MKTAGMTKDSVGACCHTLQHINFHHLQTFHLTSITCLCSKFNSSHQVMPFAQMAELCGSVAGRLILLMIHRGAKIVSCRDLERGCVPVR